MVEKATMESKTKATTWKSIKTDSETVVKNDFTLALSGLYGPFLAIQRAFYNKMLKNVRRQMSDRQMSPRGGLNANPENGSPGL